MLLSMTGYGEAGVEADGVSFRLEIRALNSRYLKTNIKLPDEYAFLEPNIERTLRKRIARGTVHYALRVGGSTTETGGRIRTDILADYLRQLDPIADVLASSGVQLDLTGLLQLPGVCEKAEPEAKDHETVWKIVQQLTLDALEKMKAMRVEEGKALREDLLGHCERIEKLLEVVRERAPMIVQQYNDRLRQRTEALLAAANADLDKDALIREVAIFAERCDVAEELSRLACHLVQFRETLDAGEQVGRTLEFITQEMLREANTIGSKANDSEVARAVVDVKGAIDRIKEQVQNVE